MITIIHRDGTVREFSDMESFTVWWNETPPMTADEMVGDEQLTALKGRPERKKRERTVTAHEALIASVEANGYAYVENVRKAHRAVKYMREVLGMSVSLETKPKIKIIKL